MHEIFVANYGSNTVSVISDTNDNVVANVTVGSNPNGIAYDSNKHEIFVPTGAQTMSQ
jgi:YVTN family beta-propeller protein